jgi:hypothetical protein
MELRFKLEFLIEFIFKIKLIYGLATEGSIIINSQHYLATSLVEISDFNSNER